MKQIKKLSYLVGLTAVLFIFVFSLTSCGLAETASDGLTNSVGSGDGPGSGKWNPPKPKNENQCQQMHAVLTTLKANTVETGQNIMTIRDRCVDAKGNFLPNANIKTCTTQFNDKAKDLNYHLADFRIGGTTYVDACNNAELGMLGERVPSAPNLDFMVPKFSDPLSPLGWTGCLTCTFNLDLEYMFAPFQSELN